MHTTHTAEHSVTLKGEFAPFCYEQPAVHVLVVRPWRTQGLSFVP
jgi:hypothetical protein